MQQLSDVRQTIANSHTRFKTLHEKRFGPITKLPVVNDSILPLQLVIPPTFHAQVQKFQLSSRSNEILSRRLSEMMSDYTKQFDDSCHKLSQSATAPLQPHLPKIVEQLREGFQTHFETQGLPPIMAEVVKYAEKRAPCSTPHLPPTRPKPFNKVSILPSTHLPPIQCNRFI